jgi:integrase
MYHRGLRATEAGLLRLEDYDQNEGRLYVRRLKGSRSDWHRLTAIEHKVLRAWLRDRGSMPGPLFLSRKRDGNLSRSTIFRLFAFYGRAAGLPAAKLHPHVLKHSCGTHLAELYQGNILRVQDHLGHAHVGSTMVYVSLMHRERAADEIRDWGKKRIREIVHRP